MKNLKFFFVLLFLYLAQPFGFACTPDLLAGCEGCTGRIDFAFTSFESVPNWNANACLFPDPALDDWDPSCQFLGQNVNGTTILRSDDLDERDYTFGSGSDNYWIRVYAQDVEYCWDDGSFNQDYLNGTAGCFFEAEDIDEINCAWTLTVEMMSQCTNDVCTGGENTGIQWKSSFEIGAGELGCGISTMIGFVSTIELESATVPCDPGTHYGC